MSQNVFENQLRNPSDDLIDTTAFSNVKDPETCESINQCFQESQDSHKAINVRVSDSKRKYKDSTLEDTLKHKLSSTSKSNIQDSIVQVTASEEISGTARDNTRLVAAQFLHQKEGEHSSYEKPALDSLDSPKYSSFNGENGNKEPHFSCMQLDSTSPDKSTVRYCDDIQGTSGTDEIKTQHQRKTIYFFSEKETSNQPSLIHDKHKLYPNSSPKKPAFFEVRGSVRSFNLHPRDSSTKSQLDETTSDFNKLPKDQLIMPCEQDQTKLSDAKQEDITAYSSNIVHEDTNSHTKQSLLLKFRKSNSEEQCTSKKISERYWKRSQAMLKINSDGPRETGPESLTPRSNNLSCESTADTKIIRFGSVVSETGVKSSVQIVSVCSTVSQTQPSSEHECCCNDVCNVDKSVGQQTDDDIDIRNLQITRQSSPTCTCNNNFEAKGHRSPSSKDEYVYDTVKVKCQSSTRKASRTSSNGEARKADTKVETLIQQQNIRMTKERFSTSISENEVPIFATKSEHEERNANNGVDDLETLLNKELSHTNITSGLSKVYKPQRFFADRATRRWTRKRLADKTSSQLSIQRELQFHFSRENDGPLKGISSNTSQSTIFSPSDITVHHSSRAIRPLAPGRFTKLEEFLQKAEQSNKTDTASSVSRAYSKLSSFTSVTPSSQEEENLQPLQNQTNHRQKVNSLKQCGSEPNDQRTISKISPATITSTKSLRFSRVHQPKSKQGQHIKVPEMQQDESDKKYAGNIQNYKNQPPGGKLSQSDCSRNNDSMEANNAACHSELDNEKERIESCTKERKIHGPELVTKAENCLETAHIIKAGEDKQQIKLVAVNVQSPRRVKDEALVESSTLTSEVSGSGVLPNKPAVFECPTSTFSSANVGISQTTEESSTVSTSSSSIVLSWIGSDLADLEETVLITPNYSDHYGKVYSHTSAQQNKCQIGTPVKDSEKGLMLINTCAVKAQEERGYLSKGTFSTDVSKVWEAATANHSSASRHMTLKELKDINKKGTNSMTTRGPQKSDVKKCSLKDLGKSSLREDVADSQVTSNENKANWLTYVSFSGADEIPSESNKKQFKCNHRIQNAPESSYRGSQCEPHLNPDTSTQTQKQLYGWNQHTREYTLEQPSYFNALIRDPKWSPSFDVKEDKTQVDQQSDLPNFGGNYVHSAWTYQNTRNISPSTFCQQNEEYESRGSLHSQSTKQTFQTHEESTTHTSYSLRSYLNSQAENYNIHSRVMDPPYSRRSTTSMHTQNAVGIQHSQHGPYIRSNKQQLKQSEDARVASQTRATSEETQSSLSRKVHFDNISRLSEKSPSCKHINASIARSRESKDISKEGIYLDEHVKASAKSGTTYSKEKFPSKQQSRSTDSTKGRRKVSLEQHLCSTLDTDNNVSIRSNAAQPTSENGTTKSTSSHASLNWYKPQSLPSSTSVNISNAVPRQQDTPRLLRTPQIEPDTAPECRQRDTESTRRQNVRTATPGSSPARNMASSSPGNTHGKVINQRNTTFIHGTRRSSLTPILAPELDRGSSESLTTLSSAAMNDNDKRQIPGFRRLRESPVSKSTRQTLPPSPSAHSSRTFGSKSTRRLNVGSDNSRGDSKPFNTPEATASTRSSCFNGKSSGNLSNKRSSHSIQSNSEKKIDVTGTLMIATTSQAAPGHAQVLKRTRGTSEISTCQTQIHNSRQTSTLGTRQKLRQSSKSSRDSHVSEPCPLPVDGPGITPPARATKRVSRLVELFEKKCEG